MDFPLKVGSISELNICKRAT